MFARVVRVLTLLGLGLAWLSAPYWWWGSAVVAAPFFGRTPTPAEQAAAERYLGWALLCAFAAPALGLAVAAVARRWAAAGLFTVAIALSVAAGLILGLFTRDSLRELRDTYAPPPPATSTPHCAELSGGGNECPGG